MDMSWRIRQRLGGVLLVCFVNVNLVCSFANETIVQEISETYANISGRNALWDSLMRDCKNPTLACIQTSMYNYLDDVLEHTDDYEVNGYLKVRRNNVSYDELDQNNEVAREEEEEVGRNSPLEEVTGALQDKAFKFMMTHDVQLQMPDMIFEGATLQMSPKSLEDHGLIAKFELMPRALSTEVGTPRILLKKIQKFIGEKLMNALLAIMLVLSLFSVKFMFFMPMVMGVAAAKKLLLKILLFFFPFLSHLFKLCPYYEPHAGTKFHHHHHQISHLHHVPHGHFPPPKHPPIYDHHPHHQDIELEYYADGPEFTNEFISHRKTDQKPAEENDLYSWIAGQLQPAAKPTKKPMMNRPLTPAEIEGLALKAEKEAVLKVRLQKEHQRVQAENKLLQDQIQQGLKLQEKLRQQASVAQQKRRTEPGKLMPGVLAGPISGVVQPSQVLQSPPVSQALPLHGQRYPVSPAVHQAVAHQAVAHPAVAHQAVAHPAVAHQAVAHQAVAHPAAAHQGVAHHPVAPQAAANTFDSFYSPILDKIDKMLVSVGFVEEPCRERLICSMYKNPTKFSPHSNLISTQLSRDASELQKPTSTNAAVIRFYRYVQAARDGQDKRECLRLYPACAINTEL